MGIDRLLASGRRPHLVVLDWMLPGEDGVSTCRRLREAAGPPVVMLTAKDEDIDRVLGLEMGADDYVSKPFSSGVLLARIRAVLRRANGVPAASEAASDRSSVGPEQIRGLLGAVGLEGLDEVVEKGVDAGAAPHVLVRHDPGVQAEHDAVR